MFAELLARSSFSFLRGASHPEEIVERAFELDLETVCLCDLDGIYGAVRGWKKYNELIGRTTTLGGVVEQTEGQFAPTTRYAIGAELTLALPSLVAGEPGPLPNEEDAITVALLVRTPLGYENLCRILTASHDGREKGVSATSLDELRAHSEGLTALIVPPRQPSKTPTSRAQVSALGEVLERHFFGYAGVAIYRHRDGLDRTRQRWAEHVAGSHGLPIVASARPNYHRVERKPLSDVMHCIRRGITLDEAGTELDGSSERVLRSEADMLHLFRDHPEWVHESGKIAQSLRFEFSDLKYRFPCELDEGESADARLRRLTFEGLHRRHPEGIPPKIERQVVKELALIAKIEVAPYFLSIREVVQIARRREILCQGRGSAANSAVCYYLGITAVDPSEGNLLFERFLSAERREPPDIDVDFEHERREEVIQEIYERYGRDKAAMVSEVISYRAKSALREVGKVFGLSQEQLDRLSSSATWWSDLLDQEKKIRDAGFDLADVRIRQVIALASELCGFPRHLSIHVGGFVLSAEELYRVAPVEPARREARTVIPWDKDDIDALGFFKMDVLGLGMLTAIRKTLALVHQETKPDEPFDPIEELARIPRDDVPTYDLICRADTVGIFQIESRAQMAMLPRLRPRKIYDLVIQVAIVRPGPIQGGMVHPFLRRRSGEEEVRYPHKSLKKILERTLGVPLFQEQVMQIAIDGADYSGGEADQLRRDMAAWKKNGRLFAHRDRLLAGFTKNGIETQFGEALFEQMKGFGEYGFPESHAASFAILVYASSWQKTHYPAQFLCSVLNSQPMGFYAPTSLVRDAQKRGIEVRDVCVMQSQWDSTLEPVDPERKQRVMSSAPGAQHAMRLGFRLVRGLGEDASDRILAARAERPFDSIDDLRQRAQLRKEEARALAEAGALEALSPGRRNALWKTEAPQTPGLFERTETAERDVALPELNAANQLVLDYERKGLSVSDHPLSHYRRRLKKLGAVRAADLAYLAAGTSVAVAGLVLNRQRPATASGVVFLTIEDETGIANLIVRSKIFDEYDHVARNAPLLLVRGRVERAREPVARPDPEAPRPGEPALPGSPPIHVLVESLERLGRATGRPTTETEAATEESVERPTSTDRALHGLSRNFH